MGEGYSGGVAKSSLDEAEDARSRNGVILVSAENASLGWGILSCCKGDYQSEAEAECGSGAKLVGSAETTKRIGD